MKNWETVNKLKIKNERLKIEDILKVLLNNRGIKTKEAIGEFLNPKLEDITIKNVGIDNKQLQKAIERIQKAIKNKERIVVFGDYDVDGICGTAVLWETLNSFGAKVMPYIPHRIEEGYGLSIKGIENVILNLFQDLGSSGEKMLKQVQHDSERGLIITVDNGIVANKAVEFANKQGIDVIITDHHVPCNPSTGHSTLRDEPSGSDSKSSGLPKAQAIVHTTKLCGAGVAYLLAQELDSVISNGVRDPNRSTQEQGIPRSARNDNLLELVALATVADLVPLVGANRTFVKFGIEQLRQTKRIGLLELFKEAGLDQSTIGVYEVGHIIAPRLNAMGRLEYAMDSLRLLCTKNRERAAMLAQKLESTNRERQELTIETVEHAKSIVQSSILRQSSGQEFKVKSLLFVSDESYQQGVIGLVAGKLVDEFYRPAIVVSIGEKYSKASARSVSGFNIIEFIRSASELLIDAGGHPMAAGFTVETEKLTLLQKTLEDKADALLDEEKLTRTLRIDCELPLSVINSKLYQEIQGLAPFGMGNPEPTFVGRNVVVEDMRAVGNKGKHLKLVVSQKTISSLQNLSAPFIVDRDSGQARMTRSFDGIAFGMGERAKEFHIGDKVDVVYTIDEDTWNGNKKLQLKIKDMKERVDLA